MAETITVKGIEFNAEDALEAAENIIDSGTDDAIYTNDTAHVGDVLIMGYDNDDDTYARIFNVETDESVRAYIDEVAEDARDAFNDDLSSFEEYVTDNYRLNTISGKAYGENGADFTTQQHRPTIGDYLMSDLDADENIRIGYIAIGDGNGGTDAYTEEPTEEDAAGNELRINLIDARDE